MDIKDIKVGQTATIKARVLDFDKADDTVLIDAVGMVVGISRTMTGQLWVKTPHITSVEDPPYEPQPGDVVTWRGVSTHYIVRAVADNWIWIVKTGEADRSSGHTLLIEGLHDLRKVG